MKRTEDSVTKPLAGLRIADASLSLAGQFSTTLLRQLGAEVVTVTLLNTPERLGTDFQDTHLVETDVYAPYLRRGKEHVTIDAADPQWRGKLAEVVVGCDALVSDRRNDLFAAELPETVVLSITPFGRTGPNAGAPASDLTIYHGGGPGHATPGLVPNPSQTPPIRLGSHQGHLGSGLAAATNLCTALLMRRRGVEGPVFIDFSCEEAMANNFRQSLGTYAGFGGGLGRDIARGRGAGGTVGDLNIRCLDGYFNIQWAGIQAWESLKELMEFPEWMDDEVLATPAQRYANWQLVIPRIEEWALQFPKELLFNLGQANKIACAPVYTGTDLLKHEELDSRGFWPDAGDGSVRLPGDLVRYVSPEQASTPETSRKLPAVTSADSLPLAGLRVLDFTQFVAGPHATLWLSSLGAEVIKIESPTRPDPFRMSLMKPGVEATGNNSPLFSVTNMLKRDCLIDITTAEGQELCRSLVAEADVVFSNFRPGVLEGFNLGYDELSKVNPGLVMTSISGYGCDSDLAAFQAFGPTIQAFSGLSAATGYVDGPPSSFFGTYGDVVAAQVSVLATLAAIERRERTGEGTFVDLAMTEAISAIAPLPMLHASILGSDMERAGNEEIGYAPHGCYPCEGKDAWVAVAAFDDEQWRHVAEVLGLDPENSDFATQEQRYENRAALDELIATATLGWDKFELAGALLKRDVASAPVRTAKDVFANEQLQHRNFMQTVHEPEIGELVLPALPWRIEVAGQDLGRPTGPAPALGEATQDVLHRLLGLDQSVCDDLAARGIVA